MREVQETSLHLDVVAKVRRGGTGLGRASDLHQGSRRLPGSKLIVPGAEAHTTSHEPVRSEDELRRTAFGVGNRRVREVFKAGLANTLNRQRSEELRPLAVNPAWCVRELRDLRPGQTDPIRGACKRASLRSFIVRAAQDYPRRVCMRPAPSTGRDDKHHAGHRSVRTRFHIWKRSPCSAFPAKAGTQSHKAGAHQRTIFDNSPNTGPPPSRGTRRMELQRDVGCILMHRDQTPVHQDAPYVPSWRDWSLGPAFAVRDAWVRPSRLGVGARVAAPWVVPVPACAG